MPDEIKTSSQNSRERVSVDLQGSKDAWLVWCRSMGLTPSEGLRALIARLRPGQWPPESSSDCAVIRGPSIDHDFVAHRPKVPLTTQELTAVARLADGEGMTVPRWIVGLIRAHLSGRPQLGAPSVEVLRQSNLEIQAVSRNLNQIARALNAITDHLDHGRLAQAAEGLQAQRGEQFRQLLAQVKTAIDEHIPLVSAVLTDNVERWRVKMPRHERSR